MPRVHDWPRRLAQILDSTRQLPFEWGKLDCALHVCNCIKAMTGEQIDPGAAHRGQYADEAGAVARFGGDLAAFAATTAAALGFAEVPITMAQRGDVVFVDNGTAHGALGVVSLDGRFASCMSDKGIVNVRIARWKRAWHVG
jgi:hypothetical protein